MFSTREKGQWRMAAAHVIYTYTHIHTHICTHIDLPKHVYQSICQYLYEITTWYMYIMFTTRESRSPKTGRRTRYMRTHTHTHTHANIHTYLLINTCLPVYLSISIWDIYMVYIYIYIYNVLHTWETSLKNGCCTCYICTHTHIYTHIHTHQSTNTCLSVYLSISIWDKYVVYVDNDHRTREWVAEAWLPHTLYAYTHIYTDIYTQINLSRHISQSICLNLYEIYTWNLYIIMISYQLIVFTYSINIWFFFLILIVCTYWFDCIDLFIWWLYVRIHLIVLVCFFDLTYLSIYWIFSFNSCLPHARAGRQRLAARSIYVNSHTYTSVCKMSFDTVWFVLFVYLFNWFCLLMYFFDFTYID